MKEISVKEIEKEVSRLCMEAAYDLPKDVENLIREGKEKEESSFGNYCLEKIIENFELAHKDQVAMCQDTGLIVIFLEIGQDVHIVDGDLTEAINKGVADGYIRGYLRKSVVNDPVFERKNTGNNAPAVIHTEIVPGDNIKIQVVPKGAGSENMSTLKMLKPAEGLEGVKDFIIDSVTKAGGNPCPPIIVGVGIGGTTEKSTLLAKTALARKAGDPNPNPRYAALEQELLEKINKLGIGPQGFGGRVTALAVHIEYYPTHIATLPVAVNLNCHAARHKEVIL